MRETQSRGDIMPERSERTNPADAVHGANAYGTGPAHGEMGRKVGVYDRPANADSGNTSMIAIALVVLILIILGLVFFF